MTAPLVSAASKGDLARVRELLESDRGSANEALVFAVIHGRVQVVRFLLEHGAEANSQHGYDRTALFYAVTHSDELIDLLLEFGADLNVRDTADMDVLNAYLSATGPGPKLGTADVRRVRHLLDRGLRVRNDKRAHLLEACSTAKPEIVELLLQRGADPNVKDILWTAHICSEPAPILAALVRGGIDANTHQVNRAMDSTILTEICRHGDLQSARLLLERGADPNAKGRSSPLAAATESGNQVLVGLLLERGARPLIPPRNAEETNALDRADRAVHEKADQVSARLARANTLHEQGFRAAAAFEAQALRRSGAQVPEELSSFETSPGVRWTFVEFRNADGLAPRTIDQRFPNAWVTDGTRTVPLILTMSAPCSSCDEKGEQVCSKCDGKGSYESYLDPDHDVDCDPRQRCTRCRGLKFHVTGARFSKGSCSHPEVSEEGKLGDFSFQRCRTCGLAALSKDFACGVCSRFACTCEFTRS